LHKLGHDDTFRQRFENNPGEALPVIGVTRDQIAAFSADSLAPVKLAPKERFQQLHAQVSNQPTTEWLCMIIPQFRIDR
ncbi:MAG: NHLP-related RiPP peptide, partial [Ktedonobacteraceae bacterium]